MLVGQRKERRLQLLPHLSHTFRNVAPSSPITTARGPPVWNSSLYCSSHLPQMIRQISRAQRCLHRHHAAPDVHTHRSRDHGAKRRDDTAHSRADPHVHIGHRRHPTMNERELGHVLQLGERGPFQMTRSAAAHSAVRCKYERLGTGDFRYDATCAARYLRWWIGHCGDQVQGEIAYRRGFCTSTPQRKVASR